MVAIPDRFVTNEAEEVIGGATVGSGDLYLIARHILIVTGIARMEAQSPTCPFPSIQVIAQRDVGNRSLEVLDRRCPNRPFLNTTSCWSSPSPSSAVLVYCACLAP